MRLALTASILIVLGSPYAGEIRGAVQASFPAQYRMIVAGTVAAGVGIALIAAIWTIRRRFAAVATGTAAGRTRLRYGLVTGAVAVASTYALTVRSGNVDVDLVEAFHFVEYGAVAFLYYRVWKHRDDVSVVVFPAAASIGVGIADEWVQWFVPGRVGELKDVSLNAVAIACGLLVGMAVHAPATLGLPPYARARLHLGATIAAAALALTAFVDVVHLGHVVHDGDGRTFRSQFDRDTLDALAVDRASTWRSSPPALRAFAREDHYLSEGEWHVRHRNLAVSGGDLAVAWHENAILERFYAPVLDRGHRWPPDQQTAMARASTLAGAARYRSRAEPYPLYVIGRWQLWAASGLAVLAIAAFSRPRRTAARGVES